MIEDSDYTDVDVALFMIELIIPFKFL